MVLIEIIKIPIIILTSILTHVIHLTVFLSILYTFCFRLGIVQRLVQRHIERELSKVLNGAQITITSMSFTFESIPASFFTASTLSITELIIHTPQRHQWKWDSPLIARVGRIDLSFNIFTTLIVPNFIQHIFNHVISTAPSSSSNVSQGNVNSSSNKIGHLPSLSMLTMKTSIKDIYSVQAYDVQVFIEKRGNVFNFHLLDPKLDIPDANQVLESIGYFDQQQQQLQDGSNNSTVLPQSNTSDAIGDDNNQINNNGSLTRSQNNQCTIHSLESNGSNGSNSSFEVVKRDHSYGDKSNNNDNSPSKSRNALQQQKQQQQRYDHDDTAETKANEIIMSIVGAVSALGQAAHQDGQSGLSKALQNQKDGFVSQLKKVKDLVGVQTNNNATNDGTDTKSSSTKASRTTIIAKEGIQVIKQVSKVVEKNVLNMKEKVDAISKPPPIKESWKPPEYPELFRVGFVGLRDVRIFTKEIISHNRTGGGHNHSGVGVGVGVGSGINGSNGMTSMGNINNYSSQQLDGGVDTNYTTTATNPSNVEFDKPTQVNSFSSTDTKRQLSLGVNNWSKPLLVKDVRIYQTDLVPSSYSVSSMLKEKNMQAMPSSSSSSPSHASFDTAGILGLEIEQVSNIIMTRVLAEIAKTNPGQLFTNAFSEVCKWFDVEA